MLRLGGQLAICQPFISKTSSSSTSARCFFSLTKTLSRQGHQPLSTLAPRQVEQIGCHAHIVRVFAAAFLVGGATLLTTTEGKSSTLGGGTALSCQSNIPEQNDLFAEENVEDITYEVSKRVILPFVPSVVVRLVTSQIIHRFVTDLSPDTLRQIRNLLEKESSISTYDDASSAELGRLSKVIADELNSGLDVPYLNEEEEGDLIYRIVRVVLAIISDSRGKSRVSLVNASLSASKTLLGSEEDRARLARALNQDVDLPFLDEPAEQALLLSAVNVCAKAVEAMLPMEVVDALKGEDPRGLAQMKQQLVARTNERVDLPGLNEDQERWLIEKMVDVVVNGLVDDTDAEFLLMNSEEKRRVLEERLSFLQRDMKLSLRRFASEQRSLSAQIDRMNEKLDAISPEPSGTKRLVAFALFGAAMASFGLSGRR